MISKAKLKYFRNLSQKKIREQEGKFLIEGWRTVEEAFTAIGKFEALLYTKEAEQHREYAPLLSSLKKKSNEIYEISQREISAIADTVTAQGIAAVVQTFTADFQKHFPKILNQDSSFVVMLDQISEPGNLGTIIRTADWFGADAIILSENCVELYNPKVVRATVGSLFHLPIIEVADLVEPIDSLKKVGFIVYGAELNGDSDIQTIRWRKKSAVVIGNEAHGIRSEISSLLDEHISIPRYGKAESLNAGIAAGIVMAHRRFQTMDYRFRGNNNVRQ